MWKFIGQLVFCKWLLDMNLFSHSKHYMPVLVHLIGGGERKWGRESLKPNWSCLEGTLDDKHCFVSSLVLMLSRVQLFVTLWTIAHQAPLSMGFPKQEYWNGLPFPPPEDLPDPGIKPTSPMSPAWQVDSLPDELLGKPPNNYYFFSCSRLRWVKVYFAVLCTQWTSI